ncbi:photosynthetic reaction center subunit H [Rhodopseudomonas rhenobacensis]|uniref:photosynthetic reaction center subunit H n=1 Tax=Rhodopseudomonas rhenobacensis TaxID=87461 RepID=UPI001611D287|nr:photosynthetic reaction center subunit H [Rhodopseudomonas rhenobacensis]
MQAGAYLDVAQVTLYVFWIFFAALIFYLRREDKREGYPLVSDSGGRRPAYGIPHPPEDKKYLLRGGKVATVPNHKNDRPNPALESTAPWPGAPFAPTGNPFLDGVGPGSYADREDVPELTLEDLPVIVPLRAAKGITLDPRDPDPRGMKVVGADGQVGGTVVEAWVDRAEALIRYLEVEVKGARGTKRILLPLPFALVDRPKGYVSVDAILGSQFADAPTLAKPDQVTKREEDRIVGYFGAGTLYATPDRQEPIV